MLNSDHFINQAKKKLKKKSIISQSDRVNFYAMTFLKICLHIIVLKD